MGAMVMARSWRAATCASARFASCLMTGMIDGAQRIFRNTAQGIPPIRRRSCPRRGALRGEMRLRAQRAIKAFVDGQSISKLMLPSAPIYPLLVVNKMTDRIQSSFELWAQKQGFSDLTMNMGRYNRAVVRWMWAAWLEQSERITDMAAALDRSHKRSSELLKQCRDHDGRRATAHALAATLAAEVDRLNETIAKLAAEGQDAHEM